LPFLFVQPVSLSSLSLSCSSDHFLQDLFSTSRPCTHSPLPSGLRLAAVPGPPAPTCSHLFSADPISLALSLSLSLSHSHFLPTDRSITVTIATKHYFDLLLAVTAGGSPVERPSADLRAARLLVQPHNRCHSSPSSRTGRPDLALSLSLLFLFIISCFLIFWPQFDCSNWPFLVRLSFTCRPVHGNHTVLHLSLRRPLPNSLFDTDRALSTALELAPLTVSARAATRTHSHFDSSLLVAVHVQIGPCSLHDAIPLLDVCLWHLINLLCFDRSPARLLLLFLLLLLLLLLFLDLFLLHFDQSVFAQLLLLHHFTLSPFAICIVRQSCYCVSVLFSIFFFFFFCFASSISSSFTFAFHFQSTFNWITHQSKSARSDNKTRINSLTLSNRYRLFCVDGKREHSDTFELIVFLMPFVLAL
jgi:hypothetical protein